MECKNGHNLYIDTIKEVNYVATIIFKCACCGKIVSAEDRTASDKITAKFCPTKE